MRKWLRRIGYVLAGFVGLVVLFVIAVYGITSFRMHRTYDLEARSLPSGAADVERGRHLATAVAKCADCHGDDLGGEIMVDDPVFARLVPSNLTRGRGGVAGRYEEADWERAIRHGVGPDSRPLVFMPAEAYWVLSDEDLASVIAYVTSVPPVDRELPDTRVGPMARIISTIRSFPLLPAEIVDHDARPKPPERKVTVAYGNYLATIGGCKSCHGPTLSGDGAPGVPDITRARLESWTEADFFRALRTGKRPDGTALDPAAMPWVSTGKMTDDEIRAVWMYMRKLPPGSAKS